MKTIVTVLLLAIATSSFAQDSLFYYNYQRYATTTNGMDVLGYWGLGNTAIGAAGWARSKGGSNYFYYKMTTIYGVTNMAASLIGHFTALNSMKQRLNAAESLKAQRKIETTFLINGCLDIAYLGIGAYIKNKGDTKGFAEDKGYGSAIITQGLFLLLFDGTMYGMQKHNGKKFRHFLEKNPISFNGNSIGITYRL